MLEIGHVPRPGPSHRWADLKDQRIDAQNRNSDDDHSKECCIQSISADFGVRCGDICTGMRLSNTTSGINNFQESAAEPSGKRFLFLPGKLGIL